MEFIVASILKLRDRDSAEIYLACHRCDLLLACGSVLATHPGSVVFFIYSGFLQNVKPPNIRGFANEFADLSLCSK